MALNTSNTGASMLFAPHDSGSDLYRWASDLFPICRSITGDGVRQTLSYLKDLLPDLSIEEVPSGTKAFDWTVPDEWNPRAAYIEDESGTRVIDFADHNLHLMGYSEPVDLWLDLDELQDHLHSLPEMPDAIPYVTSYYRRNWGFALAHRQRTALAPGKYHVVVDSDIAPGSLTYADMVIPGRRSEEILLTTCICHPSMANNELSGPIVLTALARWLSAHTDLEYSYRVLFCPETIGSITYLARHLDHMKEKVVAGYFLSCVGDDRTYSHIATPTGETLSDRAALHVLRHHAPEVKTYSFLERGGDERQFCSPGADLPYSVICRSKFFEYPEYHTSLDDLSLISPDGLAGSFEALRKIVTVLENNHIYETAMPCEPQLGKRGLYPTTSIAANGLKTRPMTNFIAYCDGRRSVLEIAEIIGESALDCHVVADILCQAGVLRRVA